ncbi:MAG: hypothetical protein ACD_62C00041G0001 [uncultured bacterium]|nr:MAG: hypothetical protein ACD_62C00041G0001 [uncultured bacterium]
MPLSPSITGCCHSGDNSRFIRAYVMLKINQVADRIQIFHKLTDLQNTVSCHAVRDLYDLVVELTAPSSTELDILINTKIMSLKGIDHLDRYVALNDPTPCDQTFHPHCQDSITEGATNVSAFILIEGHKEKLTQLKSSLCQIEGTLSCLCVAEKADVILRVTRKNFRDIHNTAQQQIRQLDGITRVRVLPIIDLFEI